MTSSTTEEQQQDEESRQAGSISDYLQAPRKKRRTYVIMALGPSFNREVAYKLETFIRKRYKGLAISRPKTAKELTRQFGRKISLLIIDDEFTELESVLSMISSLKVKRKTETIPVLFMTRNAEKLVDGYRKKLASFHEVDDFCPYSIMEVRQIIGRVRSAIENRQLRKSRRYTVRMPVTFFHLTENKTFKGSLVDLSVHGALLDTTDLEKFRVGDQLKINLPIARFLKPEHGEFMSISGKVRRIYISGSTAGVSFEYMSDSQQYMLMDFVTSMVHEQLSFRG